MAFVRKAFLVVKWGVLGVVGVLSLGMWALANAISEDAERILAENPAPRQLVAAKGSKKESEPAASDVAVACQRLVERRAQYDAEFPFFGWDTVEIGGVLHVRLNAKLMNGFGAMLPHRALCQYQEGRTTLVALEPGKW